MADEDSLAVEPLMRDNSHVERGNTISGPVKRNVQAGAGTFVYALTFAAGVSGLLFGYDTGVISSTLVSIGTDLDHRSLTILDKSLITSSTSLFALLASPITGHLADTLGRKRVILIASALFVVGALWQAQAQSVWAMIAGRSVVGLAVGSASFVVPLYIGELAPSEFRGSLVTIASLFITGGQVVAYCIGWMFSRHDHGWRWMVGLGALPAVVQLVMLFFMPETPRWLVKAQRSDEAETVLRKVYGSGEGMERLVQAVLRRVEEEDREEQEAAAGRRRDSATSTQKPGRFSRLLGTSDAIRELFRVDGNRRALTIACMLQGFQQLCGFNSLMYFSATIFALVGFTSPTLTSLSIALTNFLFTLVAFYIIDRVGRRRILLYSVPIMVIGLAACAVSFNFLDLDHALGGTKTALTHRQLVAVTSIQQPSRSQLWPMLILAAMIVYVASYAIGMGNVPWQQSELFPLSVRAAGSGLATMTNWTSNTLVGVTFLPMMEYLTPTGTFAVYSGVCVACWICTWKFYPETAGLELEDVGALLKDGWGVEAGDARWKERSRIPKGGMPNDDGFT